MSRHSPDNPGDDPWAYGPTFDVILTVPTLLAQRVFGPGARTFWDAMRVSLYSKRDAEADDQGSVSYGIWHLWAHLSVRIKVLTITSRPREVVLAIPPADMERIDPEYPWHLPGTTALRRCTVTLFYAIVQHVTSAHSVCPLRSVVLRQEDWPAVHPPPDPCICFEWAIGNAGAFPGYGYGNVWVIPLSDAATWSH